MRAEDSSIIFTIVVIEETPQRELGRHRRIGVLLICCMSLLIVGLDVTIVNVALPSIGRDFGSSVSGLQWTVDAYTLVLASLLMLSGSMADRFGRKRTFVVGLVVFSTGSLLCSLAPDQTTLVVFRMVQAVGGSMLNPVAMSIITNTFTNPRERAQAVGVWAAVVGVSMALGPVVGGVLVSSVGWRSIFWINLPVGLAAIVLTLRFIPESRAPKARRIDGLGQALVIAFLASLTYGIIEAPDRGWGSAGHRDSVRRLPCVAYRPRLVGGAVRRAPDQPSVLQIGPVLRRGDQRRGGFRHARWIPVPQHALPAGRTGILTPSSRPVHAAHGGHDHGALPDLGPDRRHSRATHPLADGRRGSHRELRHAQPDRSHHLLRLAVRCLRRVRDRLRVRQRTHHDRSGVRACPGLRPVWPPPSPRPPARSVQLSAWRLWVRCSRPRLVAPPVSGSP